MKGVFKLVVLVLTFFSLLTTGCRSGAANSTSDSAVTTDSAQVPTVRVAFLPFTGYAPIYLAEEEKLCDQYGIELQLIDTGSQSALDTVMAKGEAEVGMYANSSLAFATAAGVPLQAFLTIDQSVGADGIVVVGDVHSIQDMASQQVVFAADETDVGFYLFMAVASGMGFKADDFNRLPLGGNDALAAFLSGQVDAVAISEPLLSRALQREGAHFLFTSKDYPQYITDVFAARNSTLEAKADDLTAFARCWYDAIARVQEEPDTAVPLMAERLGLDAGELRELMPDILWPDPKEGEDYLLGGGLAESLQFSNDFYSRLALLTDEPVSPDEQISDVVVKRLGQ